MNNKYVLFDLDGTLTDSGPGIINCIRHALEKMNYPMGDDFDFRRFVGPPLSESFSSFCNFSGEDLEKSILYYRERYKTVGLFENDVYPGIEELLGKLKEDGYKLYVATSKPETFSIRICEHFGLDKYFDKICGSTMDGSRQDKVDIINYVFSENGIKDEEKSSVLMIGDRMFDVNGAKKAGIDCIGVTFGYGSREELENAGAISVCDDTEELYAGIRAYFCKK